jgi:hypothetical protein
MKALILLLSVLWCTVSFASAKKVEVEFQFFNTGITTASLYMDDVRVCTDQPVIPTEPFTHYTFECDSIDIQAGEHTFYMTAMLFGEESDSSNQFPFKIELKIVEDFRLTIN